MLCKFILKSAGVALLLSYFFYRDPLALIPMSGLSIVYFRGEIKKQIAEDKRILDMQFRECIRCVSQSLKAGYAVENAFKESVSDMKMLFGTGSMIYEEIEYIRRGLVINIPLEELLEDLADRSGSNAIKQFAGVFAIAKRSGGSLPEIIRTSSDLIGTEIEARQELYTVLAGRRMEQNIMKVMPFGILVYIGLTNPGYFDPLYGNITGVIVMTLLLGVYLTGYVLGDHIMIKLENDI